MTTQPDAMTGPELRAIRKAMGLTQGDLATALGLSKPFISMMENGSNAIEPRTEMSVRWLADQHLARVPTVSEDDARDDDIALIEAEVIWDPEQGVLPTVKVVGPGGRDDNRYTSSIGACDAGWREMSTAGRLLTLYARLNEAIIMGEADFNDVHHALSAIPEYRAMHKGMLD